MPTDAELVTAWRAGDMSAGEQLFDAHYPTVVRFFANKVDGGVEDLIQNTFLACFEGKERIREDTGFRAYLFGIARNLLFQHYREKKRDAARFDPNSVSVAEFGPGLGTLMQKREEEQLLLRALRHLPLEHQILLELYYWESERASDIGELLGVPEGTVRTRLRRAKQLLEEALEKLSDSPETLEKTASNLGDWAERLRVQIDGTE